MSVQETVESVSDRRRGFNRAKSHLFILPSEESVIERLWINLCLSAFMFGKKWGLSVWLQLVGSRDCDRFLASLIWNGHIPNMETGPWLVVALTCPFLAVPFQTALYKIDEIQNVHCRDLDWRSSIMCSFGDLFRHSQDRSAMRGYTFERLVTCYFWSGAVGKDFR